MKRVIFLLVFISLITACAKQKGNGDEAVKSSPVIEDKESKRVTISKEGIVFTIDSNNYGEITSERIKKEVFDQPMPAMAAPEHVCVYLEDKRPLPAFEKGARYFFPSRTMICVYPLEDRTVHSYLKAYSELYQAAGKLDWLLPNKPLPIEAKFHVLIPDIWSSVRQAGNSIIAKYSYQDFQSGKGVVFLTQYSQDMAPSPVNNEELNYSFQGLTNDRRYYIAASFAVTNPALPKGIDFVRDMSSAFGNGSEVDESYLREDEKTLENLSDESFQPSLKKLQAVISSLKIEDQARTKNGK